MGQVNVNPPREPREPRGPEDRTRQARTAILFTLLGILIALIIFGIVLASLHGSGRELVVARAGALATSTALAATASAPTATPISGAGSASSPTPGGATPTANTAPPTNPTAMQVTQGSCTNHTMTWSWSGANNATGYDVVLYNPATRALYAQNTALEPRYVQAGAPGQTMALKIRARNDAGHASGYYTPSDTARIPPQTTNPDAIDVVTSTNTVTWTWYGARHATGYSVILFHYNGGAPVTDKQARVNVASFQTPTQPGTTYYLKVKSLGACAPSDYTKAKQA